MLHDFLSIFNIQIIPKFSIFSSKLSSLYEKKQIAKNLTAKVEIEVEIFTGFSSVRFCGIKLKADYYLFQHKNMPDNESKFAKCK